MGTVLGGVLMAVTLVLAGIYWKLLVRPEVLLSLWLDGRQDGWFEEQHPAGLRALRWVTGVLLVVMGFLTGLAWSFLLSTE